jgi:tetratricopeptide (TPR) repeat protein
MSTQQKSERLGSPASKGLFQKLLGVLLCLAILAVGINVTWWLSRPALEPLPVADTEHLDAEIQELIASAVANVAADNRSATAWGDLGAVYYAHSLEVQSQACFRNAERLDPTDYRWPYLLAVSLSYADHEQTLAAYRRAAQRCGQRAHVQLRLAEILLDRGELEEAAAQIDTILTYASSDTRALFAKARLLFAQGKLDEAKSYAERSAENASDKRAPYMRAPYMLLAQICRRTHDAEGEANALANLKQIRDGFATWEDPEIASVLSLSRSRTHRLAVAEELIRGGNPAQGTRMLYQMTTESNGASAAEQLAQMLNREGRFAETETMLRRQLQDSPNDERLHYLLGVACYQLEKYAETEASFGRVVELKPDYGYAWHNRGLALIALGKTAKAREAFAAAVHLNPTEVASRLKLAELLLAEGKRDEAREHLKVAIKLAPESPEARELLARAGAEGK